MTSSKAKTSAKRSTKSSEYDIVREVDGMRVAIRRTVIDERTSTIVMPAADLPMLDHNQVQVLNMADPGPGELPPEETFPPCAPQEPGESDAKYAEEVAAWEQRKAVWESQKSPPVRYKKVTLRHPVFHVTKVTIDQKEVKVFHTLRGPVVGIVLAEQAGWAQLRWPAFLDSQRQEDKVLYLPVAFANYLFTVHKPCFGESVPEALIVDGYLGFIAQLRGGDYTWRGKAALHHLDVDMLQEVGVVTQDMSLANRLKAFTTVE